MTWVKQFVPDADRRPFEIDKERGRLRGQSPPEWGGLEWDIPAATEIVPGLWVGGMWSRMPLPEGVRHVVSLFVYQKPNMGTEWDSYVRVRMRDSEDQDLSMVSALARWVNVCRAQAPTLVHCHAGLNRSGLVAATALVVGPEHLTGPEALALLRLKRHPTAVCNPHFERYLTGMDRAAFEEEFIAGHDDPALSGPAC